MFQQVRICRAIKSKRMRFIQKFIHNVQKNQIWIQKKKRVAATQFAIEQTKKNKKKHCLPKQIA